MKYNVIIPSSGRNIQLIKRSIKSALNQTVLPYKIYLVDDSEKQWINYEDLQEYDINLLKSGGCKLGGAARNVGIYQSVKELNDNDFIFFLDDDDEWHPERIEKQIDTIKNNSIIDVIGCSYARDIKDYIIINKIRDMSGKIIFDNCGMSPSSIGIRVSSIIKMNFFSEGLKAWVGREFFIKIYLNKLTVYKDFSKLVFQNQSHDFGRVSDMRAIRYESMFKILSMYKHHFPLKIKYLKMMVERTIILEKGKSSIFLVIKYFPLALINGINGLRHWIVIVLSDLKRMVK